MRAREFTINIPINIKINGDGEPEISTGEEEPVDDETGTFIPPLQQKIELMKKQAGVESVYDDDQEEEGYADLAAMDDDDPLDP